MPRIKLSEIDTRAPKHLEKEKIKEETAGILEQLNKLQNVLYADGKHSILVILQGMDASGKDGAIRNVFTSVNPQGIFVKSFKVPSTEELLHDFLWRIHKHTPEQGMIQVFNRSYYEDVLVTRVQGWIDDEMAAKRMKAINHFEDLLHEHNNTQVLKFYLHISKKEQLERLNERTTDPEKHWKHNENDLKVASLFDEYVKMYEDCFEHCDRHPWTIVPADQNWYKEYVIASTLLECLQKLKLKYPALKETPDIKKQGI
jgi:PPK2 family polyphosphate:nucleotide phosphotransferase